MPGAGRSTYLAIKLSTPAEAMWSTASHSGSDLSFLNATLRQRKCFTLGIHKQWRFSSFSALRSWEAMTACVGLIQRKPLEDWSGSQQEAESTGMQKTLECGKRKCWAGDFPVVAAGRDMLNAAKLASAHGSISDRCI